MHYLKKAQQNEASKKQSKTVIKRQAYVVPEVILILPPSRRNLTKNLPHNSPSSLINLRAIFSESLSFDFNQISTTSRSAR